VHARSDLLVEMSGRLREHVNTVLGMGEVMLSTPLSPDQRGYVSSVMRNADAILDHLESTLERQKVYTTVLDLESIEFAPRSTLDEVLRRAHRKARTTDVTVKSAIGDDLPALLSGDPGRLRQVLDALLDNAIGYTDEGEVGLAAGMHGEDDDHVALWFEVSDTGLGIPADRVLKVFESGSLSTPGGDRLVRLPSHSLWNVRRLVEAMGGEITVQSEPGRGSAFRFTARFGTVQDEASLQPAIVDAVNDLRVLVAQQQQDDCLILTRMFDDMGARVRCVPSGSEAVEAVISAARAASPFDLVLLDANLDPTSGFEATRILRSLPEGRGLPVILISPSGRRGESRRCREAGCDGYLTKPVRRAELYDSVMLVLGRRITGREGLVTRHSIRESSAPRERVLIVGDDSPNAFAAARLLEGRGLETTIVTDVDAAVDTLARDGSYDLALVNLSGGAGQLSDAPGRLRGSSGVYARLPVLVIVDRGALDDRQSSIDDGASDYVSSPVDEAELVATVQRWSRKSTPSATVSGIPRAAPPALDPAPVLDRIAGDAALYAELAGMAITQIPERISTVRRAVHAGDEEGTAAALGSLLEVATTVGAAQMAAVARELSRTPDGGALDDAALRNLDMAWERLRPGLEEAAS
jgi:CheY-like chemotaxis protein/HPt (histidine-containing phosphotransfer) domain-containing protein